MSAPLGKRVQGRPARGSSNVGRERLIEAARSILRTRPTPGVSRRAVAEVAGVTPALVSYYFPENESLISAATRPIVGARIHELRAILDAGDSRHSRLVRIVSLFVSLNQTEAHLVDHAIEFCRVDTLDATQGSLLRDTSARLIDFYREGVAHDGWRPLDPILFFIALWGMCKSVAQVHAGSDFLHVDPRVDTITDMILDGLVQR